MPNDYVDVLKREFEAEEGSFLIELRCDLTWNLDSFSRLTTAMEACCRGNESNEALERWVANGFWYLSWFVAEWTRHPSFPRSHPDEYYQKAYQRLNDLAFWFFSGSSPYEEGHVPAPL